MGGRHTHAVIASSVQGWVLPHLIAGVESRDVNAEPIRHLFGRTRLDDNRVRIPEAVTDTAWRFAATLTRDEALGIHLAESLPRGALDLIEYALRSSPSLEKGLDRLARYGRLLSDRVAARTHRKDESLLFLVHDTATTPLHRRGPNLRWRSRSGWRVTALERTSDLFAWVLRIPRQPTARSKGASSPDRCGSPPDRRR